MTPEGGAQAVARKPHRSRLCRSRAAAAVAMTHYNPGDGWAQAVADRRLLFGSLRRRPNSRYPARPGSSCRRVSTAPSEGALCPAVSATPAGTALSWHEVVGVSSWSLPQRVGAKTLFDGRLQANKGTIEPQGRAGNVAALSQTLLDLLHSPLDRLRWQSRASSDRLELRSLQPFRTAWVLSPCFNKSPC